jgi:hypothetical protein
MKNILLSQFFSFLPFSSFSTFLLTIQNFLEFLHPNYIHIKERLSKILLKQVYTLI